MLGHTQVDKELRLWPAGRRGSIIGAADRSTLEPTAIVNLGIEAVAALRAISAAHAKSNFKPSAAAASNAHEAAEVPKLERQKSNFSRSTSAAGGAVAPAPGASADTWAGNANMPGSSASNAATSVPATSAVSHHPAALASIHTPAGASAAAPAVVVSGAVGSVAASAAGKGGGMEKKQKKDEDDDMDLPERIILLV